MAPPDCSVNPSNSILLRTGPIARPKFELDWTGDLKLSSPDKFLAVILAAYIACDLLLTPPFTAGCAKWMCAMNAGLDSFV